MRPYDNRCTSLCRFFSFLGGFPFSVQNLFRCGRPLESPVQLDAFHPSITRTPLPTPSSSSEYWLILEANHKQNSERTSKTVKTDRRKKRHSESRPCINIVATSKNNLTNKENKKTRPQNICLRLAFTSDGIVV